tara:strand:- start:218 stop:445 length:228 start_codon:yes stop_codon:yes gene_type:complete
MGIYRFKGVAGVEDSVYSPTQMKAIRMAKDSALELVSTKVSKKELARMRAIASLPNDIDNETIIREFITRVLDGK